MKLKRSTRKVKPMTLQPSQTSSQTVLTRRKRGGYDNDGNNRKKGSSAKAVMGTPEHAQHYFRNSGFPREYFDTDDASYIEITTNISPTITSAHDKLKAQLKLLNYLYHIENKLEVNEDLTAFRKKAIDDYRKAVQTELQPPPLSKSVINQFNAGQLFNHDSSQPNNKADASVHTHSYLNLLFG